MHLCISDIIHSTEWWRSRAQIYTSYHIYNLCLVQIGNSVETRRHRSFRRRARCGSQVVNLRIYVAQIAT